MLFKLDLAPLHHLAVRANEVLKQLRSDVNVMASLLVVAHRDDLTVGVHLNLAIDYALQMLNVKIILI